MTQWNPIETALRDGTAVLLLVGNTELYWRDMLMENAPPIVVGRWCAGWEDRWISDVATRTDRDGAIELYDIKPIGWLPLPVCAPSIQG